MSKKWKIFIALFIVATLCITVFFVGRRMVVDFVFDKVYNEVINEMREDEKKASPGNEETQSVVATVTGEDTSENQTNTEESEKNNEGSETGNKKPGEMKKNDSTTDKAIKKLSELTNQELQEIQALVTSADKAAAISIVKSALTADDKREIKAMLESGKIDYARCKQIASARLSVEQKKQIYAYYEKYARIYFADK